MSDISNTALILLHAVILSFHIRPYNLCKLWFLCIHHNRRLERIFFLTSYVIDTSWLSVSFFFAKISRRANKASKKKPRFPCFDFWQLSATVGLSATLRAFFDKLSAQNWYGMFILIRQNIIESSHQKEFKWQKSDNENQLGRCFILVLEVIKVHRTI